MTHNLTSEQRSAQRYVISLPVRAEWDDETSGEHVVADGETENVGPASALVPAWVEEVLNHGRE